MRGIKDARRAKLIYIVISACAVALAAVGAILAVLFIKKTVYPLTFTFLGISVFAIWHIPFCVFAFLDRMTLIRLIPTVEECGAHNIAAIAERIGWKEKATAKFIKKYVKKGYFTENNSEK